MYMSEISIVVPAYNAQKTIAICLDSIFDQTFKDFEIIVVNDGSTDHTEHILQTYRDKLKIINQKNRGAAAARNQGAAAASSSYIIFFDADIIAQPTLLQKMHQTLLNNPQISYAYSAFKFGLKTFRLWPFDPARLKKMPYIHTTSLIRRRDFPGFDESLKKFQDWDLWLTMLEKERIGCFIPEILFSVRPGGGMSKWLPKFFYQLPWSKKISAVESYRQAEKIIKQKHDL